VTLSFPKTGFSKTFTGSSSEDVRRQVEDFIKQNGDYAYGKFQKSINETSPLAPLSGNPQSGVGWLTAGSFSRFAFEPVVGPGAFELGGGGGLYFKADAAFIDSDHGSANTYDLAVALASRFSDRVALSLSTQFGFHDLQGSNTFLIGGDIGLPINVILPEQNQKTFGFRVSPFASGGAVVSVDLASLGLLGGGGVASALDIFLGDRIIVTVGDQIAYYAGVPVDYDDYSFDTDVDQLITRNGVKVTLPLGTGGFVDGGASYTSFLTGGAAVDGYVSPVAGIGLHFGKGNASVLRVGYSGDLGNGYVAHGGNLLLSFAW
jgi:hypothetical protein